MNKIKSEIDLPVMFEDTPLAFRFSLIAKQYYGAAHKHFEDLTIERNFFFLNYISKHKYITQQELAEAMHKDKTVIVHVIDYLSEKGLVKRVANPSDRREHRIMVTPKAKVMIKKISTGFLNLNKISFKGFSKKEKEVFDAMILKIEENILKMPSVDYAFQFVKRNSSK